MKWHHQVPLLFQRWWLRLPGFTRTDSLPAFIYARLSRTHQAAGNDKTARSIRTAVSFRGELVSGICPRASSRRTHAGSGHLSVLLARLPRPVIDRTVPDATFNKPQFGLRINPILCHKWASEFSRPEVTVGGKHPQPGPKGPIVGAQFLLRPGREEGVAIILTFALHHPDLVAGAVQVFGFESSELCLPERPSTSEHA